jgi:uncharacterized protein
LTENTINILKRNRVAGIQITLDGPPSRHYTRRIGHKGQPSFEIIMKNLKNAVSQFNIGIRINTDKIVVEHLEELLRLLSIEGLAGRITIYAAAAHKTFALSDGYENKNRFALITPTTNNAHSTTKFKDKEVSSTSLLSEPSDSTILFDSPTFAKIEPSFDDLLEKYGFQRHLKMPKRKFTTCMLDNDNGWLIEADGDVQKCWESAGDKTAVVGTLEDGGHYKIS